MARDITLTYIKEYGGPRVSGRTLDLTRGPVEVKRKEWDIIVSQGDFIHDEIGADITVSRKHVRIFPYKDKVCIEDLGSLNGTVVYIPNKGIYRLYTPRYTREYEIKEPIEEKICIEPGERAIIMLSPGSTTGSELENIIKKFESTISKTTKLGEPISLDEELERSRDYKRLFLLEAEK